MRYLILVVLVGCAKGGASTEGPPKRGGGGGMAFPVETKTVEARRVEYTVNAVGTIEPYEVVQITARVQGALDAVRFREGDYVAEGALLAQIDAERYRLAVESARAAVSKAEAAKADAEEGLRRREELNKTNDGLVRGEELATFRTRVKTAEADVLSANADLQVAHDPAF